MWSRWLRKLMARIYDNIDVKFTKGLQDIISAALVKRVDFCVGYFNLSDEARSGIKEFTLTPEFRRELFDFQQTAVKIAMSLSLKFPMNSCFHP